jgi:large subunit ribosomal protein L4
MQLEVLNIKGKKAGRKVELPDDIFGIEPNNHAIYLAVKQYLAGQRQGTHKTKTRMEVKGSSRKLHKQKGTGGSRKGNIRNPLFKGGGTIFGPEPHDYSIKLNRKVKDLAKISALTLKAKDNNIIILEDVKMDAPKTKDFLTILQALKIDFKAKKTMFVLPEYNDNVYLSLRNIPTVNGVVLSDINTYDLMNAQYLVLSESAAKIFAEEEVAAEA